MTNVTYARTESVTPARSGKLPVADDYQSMNCLNYDDSALTAYRKAADGRFYIVLN